jgi:hypothetical protein
MAEDEEKYAVKDKEYIICNIIIECYHYNIPANYNRNVNINKFTPFLKHLIRIAKYEGEYHPTCKIILPEYKDYSISESEIFNKGNVIFNTRDIINNVPLDKILLNALITCQFHSLVTRLHTDIIKRQGNVNKAHAQAGLYTVNQIYESLNYLHKNTEYIYFKCVDDDIIKNFGELRLIEDIYNRLLNGEKYNILNYYMHYKHNIPSNLRRTARRLSLN